MQPDETMAMVRTLWKIRNDNSETHIFNIGVFKSDEGVSNDILHIVRCFITKMSNLCEAFKLLLRYGNICHLFLFHFVKGYFLKRASLETDMPLWIHKL